MRASASDIKCPSHFFGKSGISSRSTIVAVKEIHFAITLPELSARMCLNREIDPVAERLQTLGFIQLMTNGDT